MHPLCVVLCLVPLLGCGASEWAARGRPAPGGEPAPVGAAGPGVEPVTLGDPAARELFDRWFEQTHGFDSLEAYEITGFGGPIQFAIARKWDGPRVRTLGYLLNRPRPGARAPRPFGTRRRPPVTAFLMIQQPGRSPLTYSSETPKALPALRNRSWGPVSVLLVAATPPLPGDYSHHSGADAVVYGEACGVVESRPLDPSRSDSVRTYVSRQSGAALRTVYLRSGIEVLRVSAEPGDVRDYAGRRLASRRLAEGPDGESAEILLRNVVVDAVLPDSLFTRRALEGRHFPSF